MEASTLAVLISENIFVASAAKSHYPLVIIIESHHRMVMTGGW